VARPWLLPLGIYFSFAAGLVAHGHNHCPMFSSRALNQVVNLATTAFFGFPTFVWVAGHNGWHHRFNNGPQDPSAGWRLSKRHNLAMAVIAPIGAMLYEPVVLPFLADAWRKNPRRFRACLLQIIFYTAGIAVGLAYNWRAFLWSFGVPWALALYLIHYFNYIQHIHCDPSSEYAHSRDWRHGSGEQ
jgi:fatty acid desaturase